MKTELQKKVDISVRLIRAAGADGQTVEVAYSGGKDSDVILELTRMSGINYRAIYKNTTIDPPGTIAHVMAREVEIIRPKSTFFQLIEQHGFPTRFRRFCCRYLKEYKVLDRCIIGVRREESFKRSTLYLEPTACRFFGNKKNHVEQFYPILDWTNQDIVDFITEQKVRLHPLYYRNDGSIDPTRRLGCMCCPLSSRNHRIAGFKRHPALVKAYLKAGQRFRDNHPGSKTVLYFPSVFHHFVYDLFFDNLRSFTDYSNSLFGSPDYKQFLIEYFHIDL